MRAWTKNVVCLIAAGSVGLIACQSAEAVVPWNSPAGSVPGAFSWSSGQTDNGLYGSPSVAGNSFTFFPNNFRAVAENGSSQTTSDRISFNLDIAPGLFVESVSVAEVGDYSITNGGTVDSRALLTVSNLNGPGSANVSATGTPTFPVSLAQPDGGASLWNIGGQLQLLPNGWTRVAVELAGSVEALSPASGTALIEKKVGGITITVNIPEPGTIALAGLAAAALLRRRR